MVNHLLHLALLGVQVRFSASQERQDRREVTWPQKGLLLHTLFSNLQYPLPEMTQMGNTKFPCGGCNVCGMHDHQGRER